MRDPRDFGAHCAHCVLNGQRPVFAEKHGSNVLLLAQAPGKDEEEQGRPLCGPSGMEVQRALEAAGVRRTDVNLANVIACRAPNDKFTDMIDKIKRQNKATEKAWKKQVQAVKHENRRRRKTGEEPMELPPAPARQLTPVECCAPRLLHDMEGIDHVIALGKWASKVFIPTLGEKPPGVEHAKRLSITDLRGSLQTVRWRDSSEGEIRDVQVVPTYNSAYVLRQLRWRGPFTHDVIKATKWFRGEDVIWQEPEKRFIPTPSQLEEFLAGQPWVSYDLESDGLEPLTCNLRDVGLSTATEGMLIPILSNDGITTWYTPWEMEEIKGILRAFFTDPTILKIGWNQGYYDRLLIEAWLGVTPTPITDGLLLHKVVQPELPHRLSFVGSLYTNVDAWKSDFHGGWDAKHDRDRWNYCITDCVVSARAILKLMPLVTEREQWKVVSWDHRMQSTCTVLHRNGMPVDQTADVKIKNGKAIPLGRTAWERQLEWQLHEWIAKCRSLLGFGDQKAIHQVRWLPPRGDDFDEELEAEQLARELGLDPMTFNPGSTQQTGKLLFGVWKLPAPIGVETKDLITDSGAKSTGKKILAAYAADQRLTQAQRDLIHGVRMYRRVQRRRSVVRKLDVEGTEKGCLMVDGRLRVSWNAAGTHVGRLSSSQPMNCQNIEYVLRTMFAASPGRKMVGADMDQLHLRIIANLWGIPSLLEVFEEGLDPHVVFAEVILGDDYRKAAGYAGYGIKPEKSTLAGKTREVAKTLRYAGAYGAKPETIYHVLRIAMDEEGHLLFPALTLTMVYDLHKRWMEAEPEWKENWDRLVEEWKENGYLLSPLLGRRKDFLDENRNDMLNWEILSYEGDLMTQITVFFEPERFPVESRRLRLVGEVEPLTGPMEFALEQLVELDGDLGH